MSNSKKDSFKTKLKSKFKNSIRNRIIFSFASILVITIILGEVFIVLFLNNYYYGGVEQLLKERASIASEFLNKYAEYSDIEGKSNFLFNTFLGESDKKFLVQTLNKEGYVVMDSFGVTTSQKIETDDIDSALQNQISVSINVDPNTKERTMSASRPLIRYSSIDGVVRYTVSLSKIDTAIRQYYATSISVSLLLIFLLIMISALLSQSIVYPIEKLIIVAREMANGNMAIRAKTMYDDEIGELSETLNYMAEEIERNDQLKKDFISSISHELRTPLTSIKGWGETLLSEEIEPGTSMEIGLQIISSEADRLKDMVEELLDFSRLESHKMRVEKTNLSFRELTYSVYNQMLPRTEGIDFRIETAGRDTLIFGDANRLRQVLINLISNSIKFSSGKSPIISIKVEGEMERVIFSITDNGIGISKKNLERVKEKFFKENMNSPGSGIGLALVDEIVKLHNGEMKIESEENLGTKITIEFPSSKNQ
ncbi:MAG: HAMP domain-containing sensor histidine kinase [Peptostreptococcaceae bacterium]|nr:HAMP domain-containing sensor histidine kinase [Peptostreptococcaceae bacterium]